LGIDPEENSKMVTELANDRTVYMLKNNMSMIIDANMEFFWKLACNNFKNYNAKLYFIKLDCEEDVILKRIEERRNKFEDSNPENYSRANINDYLKYLERKKESTFPSELIFYTINTNTTIEEIEKEIDILINKIREENLNG
jgi:thymidylate kinase